VAARGADEQQAEYDPSRPPPLDEGLARYMKGRRVFIQEPEFASVLLQMERKGNTLSAILRSAWDGVPLAILTKNNPVSVDEAHIAVVAHITRDELRRRLNATDLANGFANRFLWVYVKRTQLLSDPPEVLTHHITPLSDLLRDRIAFAQSIARSIRKTAAATEFYDAVYHNEFAVEPPGIVGQLVARGATQVLRLSLTYALLDRSDQIDVQHLKAALALWRYSEATCLWIWGDMTGDVVAPVSTGQAG